MSNTNDAVMVLAGGVEAEELALQYKAYICQNRRSFRDVQYISFIKDGVIRHLFKIVEGPLHDRTASNSDVMKLLQAKGHPSFTNGKENEKRTIYKLEHVSEVGPIQNDSVGKNGQPVPFTYGQPRYTTLERIQKAKLTSELISGIKEEVVLDKKGDNVLINPNNATIKLKWSTREDFDIAALCKNKEGRYTLVYFADKGSLTEYPYMQLDKDEMAGAGPKMETILIANLDAMEKVAIIVWDYSNQGSKANFDVSDVVVSIEDESGFESTAKLVVTEKSDSVCVASITNTPDGFVFENVSKNFMRQGTDKQQMWNSIFE
jgi:uncharacterized protein involved in tellurium resistance